LLYFFNEVLFKEEAFGFQLELIGELTILLKTNKVDLVTLNDSHLLLNIMSFNGIILKSDKLVRVRFETKIISRYLDEQYHIKRHTRENLKRIARSGFRQSMKSISSWSTRVSLRDQKNL
jgi:uncharacterized protein